MNIYVKKALQTFGMFLNLISGKRWSSAFCLIKGFWQPGSVSFQVTSTRVVYWWSTIAIWSTSSTKDVRANIDKVEKEVHQTKGTHRPHFIVMAWVLPVTWQAKLSNKRDQQRPHWWSHHKLLLFIAVLVWSRESKSPSSKWVELACYLSQSEVVTVRK